MFYLRIGYNEHQWLINYRLLTKYFKDKDRYIIVDYENNCHYYILFLIDSYGNINYKYFLVNDVDIFSNLKPIEIEYDENIFVELKHG